MNLLQINDLAIVEKTQLSRKLTLGGVTKAFPVYRVQLDYLFYNDQNDRIATWLTQYKNEPGNEDLLTMEREQYNAVIERFIIDSNPAAIEKTKNNIALVNQREPGVVLSDGRIIDGNRRFTCLRLLNKEDPDINYFETVILSEKEGKDPKAIKMLELSIQHGEEQRVDYNLIDLTIGAYQDIVENKLLTIEEYVSSTNEALNDVRRRLEVAKLIIGFLNYMQIPGQYHVAREMQVYSVFYELVPLLKRCDLDEDKEAVKMSVFDNVMMGAFADHRKYIRQVKEMLDSGLLSSYIRKQKKIHEELSARMESVDINNQADIKEFVKANDDITDDLQVSMDKSLSSSRKAETKKKPSKMINQSISTLMDVDTRIIENLSTTEKNKIGAQIKKLKDITNLIETEISGDSGDVIEIQSEDGKKKDLGLAVRHLNEPYIYCIDENKAINNLIFTLEFSAFKYTERQNESVNCLLYFVDLRGEEISTIQEIKVNVGSVVKATFSLNSSVSKLKECYLIIRSMNDIFGTAQQRIRFDIDMSFSVDFDF